jgi:hypothetical protein
MTDAPAKRSKYWKRLHDAKGGGFAVIRRGTRTNLLKPARFVAEHASQESAQAEADRLAACHPGQTFVVLQQTYSSRTEEAAQ